MKGIYAYWDNKLSQYVYIGKDSNIYKNQRHKEHLAPSRDDDQPFNSVLQNNPDRYEYRVLMEGDYNEKQLNKMEQFCIKHLKTYHYDYPERHVFNFTKGGEGTTGYKHSEETKQKISKSHIGKTHSEETKQKISENNGRYWEGKSLSEETKRKMSLSQQKKILAMEDKINVGKSRNSSGIFRVSKHKDKKCKQGFRWRYQYMENGEEKSITRVSLDKLEKEIKSRGLPWIKIEDDNNEE